ncbi:hypothetical protein IGI04_001388 [Brassica rapa subsp. trilocularis]|uniref:Uncharacterized protein n=1 Tax=Brassica rapa subsp. trilocularis TaxID=1813537 RepID=A0ABQ7NSI0_BRACM|nr:hypothetical protein IGI04_001388 [Brassica rapa subsp. trilocularis]
MATITKIQAAYIVVSNVNREVQMSLKLSFLEWTHNDQLLHQVMIAVFQQYQPSSNLIQKKMDGRMYVWNKYSG